MQWPHGCALTSDWAVWAQHWLETVLTSLWWKFLVLIFVIVIQSPEFWFNGVLFLEAIQHLDSLETWPHFCSIFSQILNFWLNEKCPLCCALGQGTSFTVPFTTQVYKSEVYAVGNPAIDLGCQQGWEVKITLGYFMPHRNWTKFLSWWANWLQYFWSLIFVRWPKTEVGRGIA